MASDRLAWAKGTRRGWEAPADVLVLAYHAVSDDWNAVTTVTVTQFRAQMEALVERGYSGATLSDALSTPVAEKVVAVTFDDAHHSVYSRALPILRELGLPGTVFAPTDYIGTNAPTGWEGFEQDAAGPHADELICSDWDELRNLVDEGWEIGSHTCSHPHLTRLTDDALRHELVRSREVIEEQLQRGCPTLAYPYSDHDRRVVAATRDAGYTVATTLPVAGAISLPLRWPRVGVFRTDSQRRFDVVTSQTARSLLGTAIGDATAGAIRQGKALLRGRSAD